MRFDLAVLSVFREIAPIDIKTSYGRSKRIDAASLCNEVKRDEKNKLLFELLDSIYNCVYDSLMEAKNAMNGSQELNK